MKLITINADESIIEEVIKKLKEFPQEKLQINDEPILDVTIHGVLENTIEEEDDDELDDYFMIDEDRKVMPFEIEIQKDEEYSPVDGTAEIHVRFENGRHYFGFYAQLDEVTNYVFEDEYYFSGFVIVKIATEEIVRRSILDMIDRREFFEAFDDADEYGLDDEDDELGIDEIDPIRKN